METLKKTLSFSRFLVYGNQPDKQAVVLSQTAYRDDSGCHNDYGAAMPFGGQELRLTNILKCTGKLHNGNLPNPKCQ